MESERLNEVLNCCHHYDEIISYNIKEDDNMTKDIINYYQDFVFLNYNNKDKITLLDLILYDYIKNRDFYNYLQERFKEEGDILPLFDELKNLYEDYKKESSKIIENAVWI